MTTLETQHRAAVGAPSSLTWANTPTFDLFSPGLTVWRTQSAPSKYDVNGADRRIARARVVSDEIAPFVWANDEPDVEDEILLPRPQTTPVNVVVVSRERPPFIFHEDELECEDEILLSPPQMTYGVGNTVSTEAPPFIFHDEWEESEL